MAMPDTTAKPAVKTRSCEGSGCQRLAPLWSNFRKEGAREHAPRFRTYEDACPEVVPLGLLDLEGLVKGVGPGAGLRRLEAVRGRLAGLVRRLRLVIRLGILRRGVRLRRGLRVRLLSVRRFVLLLPGTVVVMDRRLAVVRRSLASYIRHGEQDLKIEGWMMLYTTVSRAVRMPTCA
jgi:hypothetical protein